MLANFARNNLFTVNRGTFQIRIPDEEPMAAAAFGNDDYSHDVEVRREIAMLRGCLSDRAADELGFGTSDDGRSWALIVRPQSWRYRTAVGKKFQTEMLKGFLGDVVQGTWRTTWNAHCEDSEELAPQGKSRG